MKVKIKNCETILFSKLIMYESNTNTNTENKKAFQKWLSQIPDNAFVDYQKQFRDEPKIF